MISSSVTSPASTAGRSRRYSVPNSSFGSAATRMTVPPGAQAWCTVALGSPNTTSAAKPSSSWASTLSVPQTAFVSFAQAYCASQVRCAPPITATDCGPKVSAAAATIPAAASKAAFHATGASSPAASRMSGSVRRSGWLLAWKLKRSRSLSQPQFTASESIP